jgi:hypothetical protein
LQQRAVKWNSGEIVVVTKQADDSIPLLGWPIARNPREVRQYRQVVYWPNTTALGEQREDYHEKMIYDLLAGLWQPDANVVLAFDEIGYIEDLSPRLKKMIRMYWREGRSHGVSLVAMKQRPVGVQRDQHSESRWKVVFPPAHQADMEPFAELLGRRGDWQPVLESLDQRNHEFVIRNSVTNDAYISWVDTKLEPVEEQVKQGTRTPRERLYGQGRNDESAAA